MGRLVGIVRLDGGPIDRAIVDRWRKGAGGFQPSRVRADAGWAFAQQTLAYQTGEPAEPQPYHLHSGARLFVEARIDARAEMRALFGSQLSDSGLVAAAIDRGGVAACEPLHGEFALAHWDESTRTLTLARDALGQRALFYWTDGESVIFATSIHLLLAMPQVPRDIDELGLTDLLMGASDSRERTLYKHIRRVPTGGLATFRPGSLTTRQYWTPDTPPDIRFARDDDYVEAARELFDRAVASRLPETGTVAAMLSGGFDSAAVTATAARMLGDRRLSAFTRVPGGPDPYAHRLDERAFAGLVAARYPNIDWEVIDTLYQAPRDAEPQWESAAMGVPTNAFARSWMEPVHNRAAAIGARTLLGGHMGNVTLSWSGHSLPYEQVHAGHWLKAILDVVRTARREQAPLGHAIRQQLASVFEPAALRRWRRRRADKGRWPAEGWVALSRDFLEDIDYGAHMSSAAHDNHYSIALPPRTLRGLTMLVEGRADQYAWLRGEWPFEMLDPFVDRKLVEFTFGVPETQYARNGVRRWLARRVLADRLPPELLAQTRRGRQMGEWYTLANMRRDHTAAAVERIARSPLASRVLDVPRLQRLLDTWPKDMHAARKTESDHRVALHQGVVIGTFLAWHEGSNG